MIASKSRFLLLGVLAVPLVAAVGLNERVRSSASRRVAGQMESIVQGVVQRAIELVVEALVANTDLGARMASSTSTLATEAADLEDATRQAITGVRGSYGWANTLARVIWVSRLRRNHAERTGPPESPNAQEEP